MFKSTLQNNVGSVYVYCHSNQNHHSHSCLHWNVGGCCSNVNLVWWPSLVWLALGCHLEVMNIDFDSRVTTWLAKFWVSDPSWVVHCMSGLPTTKVGVAQTPVGAFFGVTSYGFPKDECTLLSSYRVTFSNNIPLCTLDIIHDFFLS